MSPELLFLSWGVVIFGAYAGSLTLTLTRKRRGKGVDASDYVDGALLGAILALGCVCISINILRGF